MHVLHTYTFKMDRINSNREKVATSICFSSPEPIGSQGELDFDLNTLFNFDYTELKELTGAVS